MACGMGTFFRWPLSLPFFLGHSLSSSYCLSPAVPLLPSPSHSSVSFPSGLDSEPSLLIFVDIYGPDIMSSALQTSSARSVQMLIPHFTLSVALATDNEL